ncbi:hypothetical protein [Mycobacterium leprae]|uniref:U1756q n=2 Tax=Mycobacterium leprae TaxID=1769 RepID=Q49964_MYCLR|nr:hypothetical protein [Mycobacterium leprae]AAA62888.1 u1756q [Mycobacterium leprae]OAR20267.1 hypothetical protein A8144_11680 [Mycobacterium leprae 3125609]OAX70593.1 hypothetical protein A3216_11130 [Mycobacterium leprae 7935681]
MVAIMAGTATVQLTAIWLLTAVKVQLLNLARRFTPVPWVVLIAFFAFYLIGSLAGFSQWVFDLEPFTFTHVPWVGGGDFTIVPLLWLLAIDAVLITLVTKAFQRCDLCN